MARVKTPEWVKDAVFYQIFPDRFAKGTLLAKPQNLEPWESAPTRHGYKGGDLYGVIDRLDHVQELGATAIYFTPIFQSASNHRYHTHDYFQVDPLLGGNAAFYALRDEMKRRGMRLVLDGVFNHAGRGNFYFNDVVENGKSSPWRDWFIVEDWPIAPYDESRPSNYASWANLRALPKWNTDNPLVREYLMRVAEHWLREGIDGWRLDVPFCITSPGFWNEFRDRVKAINEEAYIVGEVWWDSTNYLQGDQFDGVMNYIVTEPIIQFCGQQHLSREIAISDGFYDPYPSIDGEHFAVKLEKALFKYDWQIALTQLNLLDSHDTARFVSVASGDKSAVKLGTILLLTLPGAPSIYYGDEIGLPGAGDFDSRRTIDWENTSGWDRDAFDYHKALVSLRKAHPSLRRGKYTQLHADATTFGFARDLADDKLLVVLNVGEKPAKINVRVGSIYPDGTSLGALFGRASAVVEAGSVRLTVPARDGLVLAPKPRKSASATAVDDGAGAGPSA